MALFCGIHRGKKMLPEQIMNHGIIGMLGKRRRRKSMQIKYA